MTQLVTIFSAQLFGCAIAMLYLVAVLAQLVAWSWRTFGLLVALLGLAGTLIVANQARRA